MNNTNPLLATFIFMLKKNERNFNLHALMRNITIIGANVCFSGVSESTAVEKEIEPDNPHSIISF